MGGKVTTEVWQGDSDYPITWKLTGNFDVGVCALNIY